jgi:hypothetical protein
VRVIVEGVEELVVERVEKMKEMRTEFTINELDKVIIED